MSRARSLQATLPPELEAAYRTGSLSLPNGERRPIEPDGIERTTATTLRRLAQEHDATRTLETGMGVGLSALAIASVHAERGSGEHLCIDPNQSGPYGGVALEAVRRAGVEAFVRVIEQPSHLALPRLLAEDHRIDLAFIDGQHLYDYVLLDFFYCDLMLDPGGMVAVHDTWMPSIQRALAFALSNRSYDRLEGRTEALDRDQNLAVLVKRGEDSRAWDFDHPFEVPATNHRHPPDRRRNPPARATISLCMTAGRRPAQARAILEQMRPHVDEIVLAADTDLPAAEAIGAGLADRLLTYETPDSPARLVGWINGQCESDWILQLDDDEVPGASLLEMLPVLVADRWTTNYRIRRRWLHGSAERWIAGMPWEIDWAPRLVRNLPGLWRFEGTVHTALEVEGDWRAIDAPYYHLDLLLNGPRERRAKASAYEAMGRVRFEDYDVNDLYHPEGRDLDLRSVPPADLALIRRVLEAPEPERGPAAEVEGVADPAEIERWSWARLVEADSWRGQITFIEPRGTVSSGGRRFFLTRVANLGSETWTRSGPPAVQIATRWLDLDGERVLEWGERHPLPCSIRPSQVEIVPIHVEVPPLVGRWVLEANLTIDGVGRVGDPARTPIEIGDGPAAGREIVSVHNKRLRFAVDQLSSQLSDARRTARRAAVLEAELQGVRAGRRYRVGSIFAWPFEAVRRIRARRRPAPPGR